MMAIKDRYVPRSRVSQRLARVLRVRRMAAFKVLVLPAWLAVVACTADSDKPVNHPQGPSAAGVGFGAAGC